MNIDPVSAVPIYRQIADDIRRAIASGVYKPGEMIPSIRATSLDAAVNPNTVQRAYELLERDGLVTSRKGLGMFVTATGAREAQSLSMLALSAAFAQTITKALAAGLPSERITSAFDKAWREVRKEARLRS